MAKRKQKADRSQAEADGRAQPLKFRPLYSQVREALMSGQPPIKGARRLLVEAGIYMLEFLNLAEPAAAGDHEGVLAVAPLKVTGATGSPVNPIFIT